MSNANSSSSAVSVTKSDIANLTPELRAMVEHLASELARAATLNSIWQSEEPVSYWVLLVTGTGRTEQMQVAKELLTWSAFAAKGSSRVACVQTSDSREFNLCAKHFGAAQYPALFLGTSPEMTTFVGFPKAVLQKVCTAEGGLHDFLTEIHTSLANGDSTLADINRRLQKENAANYAGMIYRELKGIVSFKGSADVSAKF